MPMHRHSSIRIAGYAAALAVSHYMLTLLALLWMFYSISFTGDHAGGSGLAAATLAVLSFPTATLANLLPGAGLPLWMLLGVNSACWGVGLAFALRWIFWRRLYAQHHHRHAPHGETPAEA